MLAGLLGAAALSVPATATAQNPTTTSVNCVPGDRVVGSIPTTCSATVTDTVVGGTPPAGNVNWSSNNPGTFTQGIIPTTQCLLVPNGAASSLCQINYAPTAVGTGSHMLTGGYAGSPNHFPSSGSFNLIVTDPPSGGGGTTTTPAPTTTPPKKCKKGRKLKRGKCVKKKKKK